MARRKRQFIGFGFDPGESSHHFVVIIQEKAEDPVNIEERFEWEGETETVAANAKAPVVKVRLDRYRWDRIADVVKGQFNKKIRAAGHRSVSWKANQLNILPPHFGKELILLAWAVEDIDESLIPNVIANWTGLEPEERWWLYTTINATFTREEIGKDRGWRKAIKIAFSENPVPEIPGERFVEEPEPMKLPKKDETKPLDTISSAYPPRKKKPKRGIKNAQTRLFEDV